MKNLGLIVIRFENKELFKNPEIVLSEIKSHFKKRVDHHHADPICKRIGLPQNSPPVNGEPTS
jgi:hypothetical protein